MIKNDFSFGHKKAIRNYLKFIHPQRKNLIQSKLVADSRRQPKKSHKDNTF